MDFEPLEFPSDLLDFSASEASFDNDGWFCEVMEVRFAGEYPSGSAGAKHARFMRMSIAAALALQEPDVVLLDLRDFTYQWGDNLLGVLQLIGDWNAEEPVAFVIATSKKCDAGLSSLLTGPSGDRPATLFHEYEQALLAAQQLALERSERIG